MRASTTILVLALLLAGASGQAKAAGDPSEGQKLASSICKRCHVIGAENLHGSIGSTPSFFLMKEKLDDGYRDRILSLTARRPHIAQEFDLDLADLEHLLAYIETLERP